MAFEYTPQLMNNQLSKVTPLPINIHFVLSCMSIVDVRNKSACHDWATPYNGPENYIAADTLEPNITGPSV